MRFNGRIPGAGKVTNPDLLLTNIYLWLGDIYFVVNEYTDPTRIRKADGSVL